MERSVASSPQQRAHLGHHLSTSRVSVSTPSYFKSASLPPIPFSAIQSSNDVDNVKSDSDLCQVESDLNDSVTNRDNEMLSEDQLIARGRVLLQSYQSQKKKWYQQNGKYDSREVNQIRQNSVNIFQSTLNSNGEYSTVKYSSPKNIRVDAPSIDTKLDEISPLLSPSSPPPSNIVSGSSTFSIGPPSTLKLTISQQPFSGNKSEKSWKNFMQLLKTNGQIMDMVDEQLAEIWGELVSTNERVKGSQSSVDKLSQFVTQLLLQKREAEIAIAKLVEVLGSRVFLTGKLTDDAVQFVSNQLRLELEASQVLVERVKVEKTVCKKEDEAIGFSNNGNESLLRQQLQDNEQQLQSSRAAVAKLKDELAQQKEAADKRQEQLEQVLEVKLREIDALCNDVDLPMDYERTKTTGGVVCYRRKGSDGTNELEDPRVPIALKLRSVRSSAAASARAGDKEAIIKHDGIGSSGKTHRLRGISAMARDYAARDNVMRRSSSSPHITRDSNVLADIPVPPDDGRKHTIEDFSTPLPAGWEMRVTASGGVFFLNKYTTTTTWTDPRLLELAPTSSSANNDSSQQRPLARISSAVSSKSRPSRSNSTTLNSEQFATREENDGVEYIDVVFEERGPIGIHFQANVPDSGATVRSLLPDMAAAKMNVVEPYDELVAVNKNAVDSAPFHHVMLLLQGGLRPLTLTFKRNLNHSRCPMSPVPAAPSSNGGASLVGWSDVDEEVVLDDGTVVDLEQLRVPVASNPIPAASGANDEEDMNVADVIISNIFSLFWKPPETTEEEDQTV